MNNFSYEYRATENLYLKRESTGNAYNDTGCGNDESSDDDIEVVKEVKGVPHDTKVETGTGIIQIHSIPNSNPITKSNLDVDRPLVEELRDRVLLFRNGHNLHSLFATWGRLDQLSLRRQRLIRLLTLTSMVEKSTSLDTVFKQIEKHFVSFDRKFNSLLRQIKSENYTLLPRTIKKEKVQLRTNKR